MSTTDTRTAQYLDYARTLTPDEAARTGYRLRREVDHAIMNRARGGYHPATGDLTAQAMLDLLHEVHPNA